jgi:ribonuclease T1
MQLSGNRTAAIRLLLALALASGMAAGCTPPAGQAPPPDARAEPESRGEYHRRGEAADRDRGQRQQRRERESEDTAEATRRPRERGAPAGRAPEKVGMVLRFLDEHHGPPPGYEGGRTFHNAEGLLPKTDAEGRPIHYREWDVNPKLPGVNRGAERLVTGSDGSAYYTADHYRTFVKIR